MSDDTTSLNRVMSRVRKMLALARDAAASEGERDNALRMAHATMAKYNLDALEVEGAAAIDDPRVQHDEVYLGKLWARHINKAVAELFFCKYYFSAIHGSSGPNEKNRHTFIGKRSNAQIALELARYIVECTNKEAARRQRAEGQGFAWHRSFCLGVAIKIMERCRALRTEGLVEGSTAAQGPGTAIVLASLYKREMEANEGFLANKGVILRTGRQGKGGYSEAMGAGKAYGATVSLTPNRTKRIK